jgi:molybdopterin-containing oxidoreductase family membrane subunit
MVLTLAIPLRKIYGLEDFITAKHLDNMAKILLATGLIVGYGYVVEAFMSFYSGNPYERFMIWNRLHGPYKHAYWALLFCNLVMPQALWFRNVRRSVPWLFAVAMVVNVGMWLERYVIVVVSLSRDFVPSSWGLYKATIFDWATFIGTIGLFLALMFLFIRLLPMISIFEMRAILPEAKVEEAE